MQHDRFMSFDRVIYKPRRHLLAHLHNLPCSSLPHRVIFLPMHEALHMGYTRHYVSSHFHFCDDEFVKIFEQLIG